MPSRLHTKSSYFSIGTRDCLPQALYRRRDGYVRTNSEFDIYQKYIYLKAALEHPSGYCKHFDAVNISTPLVASMKMIPNVTI